MSDEGSGLLTQNEAATCLDLPVSAGFTLQSFGALRAGWRASSRRVGGA